MSEHVPSQPLRQRGRRGRSSVRYCPPARWTTSWRVRPEHEGLARFGRSTAAPTRPGSRSQHGSLLRVTPHPLRAGKRGIGGSTPSWRGCPPGIAEQHATRSCPRIGPAVPKWVGRSINRLAARFPHAYPEADLATGSPFAVHRVFRGASPNEPANGVGALLHGTLRSVRTPAGRTIQKAP